MAKFFIHIPKNGGMSIRQSDVLKKKIIIAKKDKFKDPTYPKAVRMKMRSTGDHHGLGHARYRDINPTFTKGGAFAIVRNPWSKVVSRYLFAKSAIEIGDSPENYADVRSLEHFIEERHKWANQEYMWHRAIRGWYPQLEHVVNDQGIVSCDILRLEHLNEDIEKYFGIEKMSRPRNITRQKADYKTLYTPRTIQIIADWYKSDIDYWDFDFDTTARKNIWIGKNTI